LRITVQEYQNSYFCDFSSFVSVTAHCLSGKLEW
jgi:hypothetical protein